MVRKTICLIALVLLILPLASAMTTNVNVETLPEHKVFVSIQNPETLTLLGSKNIESGSQGKATLTVDSGSDDEVNIIVKITKDGVKIALKKFENQANGIDAYYLVTDVRTEEDYKEEFLASEEVVADDTAEEVVADEAPAEEVVVEEKPSGGALTGFMSAVGEKIFSKTSYYILGAIVAGLLLFIVIKKIPKMKGSFSSSSTKKEEKSLGTDFNEQMIKDAEEKIAAAQAEIRKIKNQSSIASAEAKLKRDMEALEKLKRGE